MKDDPNRLVLGPVFESFWRLVTVATVLSFSLLPLLAQSSASSIIPNWHALGSTPCVMQDQAWGKNSGPSHPLDVNATIKDLRENGFDCYVLGIAGAPPYSFNDLKRLLPALDGTGISVWAELFPPSEPAVQLPYKKNYVKGMGVLGHLSRHYPELRGVNIDDYQVGVSSKTFTRDYTCRIYRAEKEANPKLLFVPTLYELGPPEVRRLSGCIDGVWLWWTNLGSDDGLRTLLENTQPVVARRFPVYAGVYAHSTSWHRDSGPAPGVLEGALRIGCRYSDGVVMWNLPLGPRQSRNPLLAIARNFVVGGSATLSGRCGHPGMRTF